MNGHMDGTTVAMTLRRALPHIRLFKGRTFVLKAGGALCGDPSEIRELVEQMSVLHELGIRVVLVHGGGPQTTALSTRLGLETTFVEGRRVTSPQTLDVAIMTICGSVNTALVAACRAAGLPAVGLSGIDAGLVRAQRRAPVLTDLGQGPVAIDYGLVGDVVAVDSTLVDRLLDNGFVPIISPLCADDSGQVLNVNADTVASRIATQLRAGKLLFLTDTPGILEDKSNPATLVSYTDIAGLRQLIDRGIVDSGMLPKAQAAISALEGGVGRVHLVGYKSRSSLLTEIFTNEGAGTLVVRDTSELLPSEQGVPGSAQAAE